MTGLLELLDKAVPGRVTDRASTRLAQAHDASHYLLVPELVATAASVDDVVAIARTCTSAGRSLTFRSGGTSLSGQAGSEHVLVDTRQHFREITVLDDGARVRVQPGATVRAVNARLSPYGTRLGPDPASETACTIGGVVANNSSGMACGTELNSYRTLESVVLVLASGTVINTAQADCDRELAAREPALVHGLLRLRDRIRSNPVSVRTIEAQFAMKNTMGYGVNAFLDFDRPADILAHLVVGSEGTLAFVAEATFRTVPVQPYAASGLVIFPDLRSATMALPDLVAADFATIELLDATSLRVCQQDPQADARLRGLEVESHAALLVEHQEGDLDKLQAKVAETAVLLGHLGLAHAPDLVTDATARAKLWHLRKGLYAAVAGARSTGTTALLEDVAVPVAHMADVCEALTGMFSHHGYKDSVIFGHAKDGNLHFMLNERFDQRDALERYLEFTDDMVDLVLNAGGTLKAEHGTGRIMAPFVRRQFGDELYDVMVQVKRLCDPAAILNPGVVINDDPRAHVAHLKTTPTVESEVDRCVECGFCEPVCPSKDLTLTPRTRIVLRREIAKARERGDAALVAELEGDYSYAGIDTCAADGMCQTACPVQIDTGSLVTRLRAQRHSTTEERAWTQAAQHWHGTSRAAAWALNVAAALPPAVPQVATRAARRLLGAETVPTWSPDLPKGGRPRTRRRHRDESLPQDGAFVHFPACVGSMFGSEEPDSSASEALTILAKRVGVGLLPLPEIDSLCCGTPWKSKGLPDGYTTMRQRVAAVLWRATDQGRLPVVCDAASCTEGLTKMLAEAPEHHPLRVLDAITFAANEVLPRLATHQKMDSAVLHPTCSTTRMGVNDSLLLIARAVANRVHVPLDWACCAFAGDRGLLRPELTASATRAEALEVAVDRYDLHLSANRTCEIGMSRATGRHYEHALVALERSTRS